MSNSPNDSVRTNWERLAGIIHDLTGRRLVGTDGGLYCFSDTEIRVPDRDVEGATHELCHWVVATEEQRRQPNMGLVLDVSNPGFEWMVRCEELAWSLELFLFGDPTSAQMRACMTLESRASGSGAFPSSDDRDVVLEAASLAELAVARDKVFRHGEQRPDGTEDLRRDVLRVAGQVALPVRALQSIIRNEYAERLG